MEKIDILKSESNLVVAHYSEREFPGLLIQGDTFKIILDDLHELLDDLDLRDIEAAKSISKDIHSRISTFLKIYEAVLTENKIAIPYQK